MAEKQIETFSMSSTQRHTRATRPHSFVALLFIALTTVSLWFYLSSSGTRFSLDDLKVQDPSAVGLVPLEAHIISKCPDTRDAMRELILPVMQQVSEKVDFKLTYIGKPTANDGVECKHGPSECMGNIIELCARELYPDPKISLGFVMCLSKDYKHIPDRSLVEDCALEHALDMKALNDCATDGDGAYGMELLRDSVERSQKLGITTSCTIRLDNEIYCVRDDGEWPASDCPNGPGVNDMIVAIEKLYHQRQQKLYGTAETQSQSE